MGRHPHHHLTADGRDDGTGRHSAADRGAADRGAADRGPAGTAQCLPHPAGTVGNAGSAAATRVLIVDDHAVVRRGIRACLEALDGMEVAGEAVNGHDALNRLRKLQLTSRTQAALVAVRQRVVRP